MEAYPVQDHFARHAEVVALLVDLRHRVLRSLLQILVGIRAFQLEDEIREARMLGPHEDVDPPVSVLDLGADLVSSG